MISEKTIRSVLAFLLGCIITTNIQLILKTHENENNNENTTGLRSSRSALMESFTTNNNGNNNNHRSSSSSSPLDGIRILVAVTSFDFGQMPHLEEVIESYQDLCVTSVSKIDIVIYTAHAYPVSLIDLWNNRIPTSCRRNNQNIFSLTIIVKPYSMRLFLVDCHRYLFYEKINEYDIFIYTEDDMIVHPKLIASYIDETNRVIDIVGLNKSQDFNVGIVRYEYNFPSNVVIDDNTRHSTQNVTRIYWEHYKKPIFAKNPKAASRPVRNTPELENTHIQMTNHHQGMFLVTQYLLKAWKDRPGCDFSNVRMHPNHPTQRVWMSSFMMYGYPQQGGPKACNIQQVLPVDTFGTLNVYHLPNKNHRRVGKFKNRTMSDGTEPIFDFGGPDLLSAMDFHIEIMKHNNMGQQQPQQQQITSPNNDKKPLLSYNGIRMVDDRRLNENNDRTKNKENDNKEILMETDNQRFKDYNSYVKRGGIMSENDMENTDLMTGDTYQRQTDLKEKHQKKNKIKHDKLKQEVKDV